MLQQKYKKIYQDIKPDVVLMEETKERMKAEAFHPRKSQKLIIVFASVAAVAVLTVAAAISAPLLFHNDHLLTHSSENASSSTESGEVSSTNDTVTLDQYVPDWYEPGEITVITLKNSSDVQVEEMFRPNTNAVQIMPLGATLKKPTIESIDLEIPQGLEFKSYADTNYIELYTTDPNNPYYRSEGIYYDLSKKKVISFDHKSQEAAKKAGLITDRFSYAGSVTSPVYNVTILYTQDKKTQDFQYYVRYPDNRFEKLDITGNGAGSISADQRYVRIETQPKANKLPQVWLIDLAQQKVEAKCVSILDGKQQYVSQFDTGFTSNGKFLIYMIKNHPDETPKRGKDSQWIFYHLETGTWTQINADIQHSAIGDETTAISLVNDGKAVIGITHEGAKVFDLITGEDITATTKLEEWEKVEITNDRFGGNYSIYSKSLFEKNTKQNFLLTDVEYYSIKGNYIYAMRSDAKSIICYSLKDNDYFSITIPDSFFDEVKKNAKNNNNIFYYFEISPSGESITPRYNIGDSYIVCNRYNPTNVYEVLPYKFWMSNHLSDMSNWIENVMHVYTTVNKSHFESASDHTNEVKLRGIKLYEGDGFSFLWFRFISYMGNHTMILVEDYRDRTFTLYNGDLFSDFNGLEIFKSAEGLPENTVFRKKLSPDASQEKTREAFSYLKKATAPVDYATVYTDGALDQEKIILHYLSMSFSNVTPIAIGTTTEVELSSYEWKNADELEQIMKLVRNQTFEAHQPYKDSYGYKNCNGIFISMNHAEHYYQTLYIGRQKDTGKPFIYFSGFQSFNAFLSEEEYKKMETLLLPMIEQARQAHLDNLVW